MGTVIQTWTDHFFLRKIRKMLKTYHERAFEKESLCILLIKIYGQSESKIFQNQWPGTFFFVLFFFCGGPLLKKNLSILKLYLYSDLHFLDIINICLSIYDIANSGRFTRLVNSLDMICQLNR